MFINRMLIINSDSILQYYLFYCILTEDFPKKIKYRNI